MKLSDDERAELAVLLEDSVGDGSSDEEIEAAWIAEAKRRLEEIESGKVQPIPWEEVAKELEEIIRNPKVRAAG